MVIALCGSAIAAAQDLASTREAAPASGVNAAAQDGASTREAAASSVNAATPDAASTRAAAPASNVNATAQDVASTREAAAASGVNAAAQDAASTREAAPVSDINAEAQDMLYYVCGQAGLEKTATSPDPKHPFNLAITFVGQQNGAPLSDVAVRLRRHGRVLMDFVAGGPRCLFSVPSASYRVEGTYHGEMKYEIVETETFDSQIKW
ncbi:MAG: hypothetical protein QOI13_3591, partial [Paraburkholderia sp.]|nr:hypothetical protein [Paraburkholderia sp.]